MTRTLRLSRLWGLLGLAAASLALSACAGGLDWCGDGLNPPSGGWDSHGPG
jgi:hypothetical protein